MTPLLLALLASTPDVNLLSLEAGGVPLEQPATYGGAWTVEGLVDGAPDTNWCSAAGAQGPFRFSFELAQRSVLGAVDVDASHVEESSNPGISARTVEVWGSPSGPAEGFALLASFTLPRAGAAHKALPRDTVARWIRVVITGNWGNAEYTELSAVSVTGHGLEPVVTRPLDGTWVLEDGATVTLGSEGARVRGCELQPARGWTCTGQLQGRVARLEWAEVPGEGAGEASVVVSDDGATLRGSWRARGGGSGVWHGKRVDLTVSCPEALDDLRFLTVLGAAPLGLSLGGLSFDVGDEPRFEAHGAAASLVRLLGARRMRVRLLVLGRASDPANDELKHLEQRAKRLLAALRARGVPEGAVDVGFGLLRVGSAVQVEPRVEVVRTDG